MDHIMTTSVVPGDLVSVIPLPPILPVDHRGPGKGIKLPEAKSITLTELEPNLNSQRYSNNSEAQLRPGLRPDGQLRVGRMWKGFTREVLVDRKYLAINHHVSIPDNLGSRILRVDDIKQAISSLPNSNTKQPLELFVITRNTEITINPPVPSNDKKSVIPPTESDSSQPCPGDQQVHLQTSDEVGYDAVGGLDAQVEQIRDLVELPLTRPELYSHFGLAPPRGILLYGPPGTGKTLLASIVAKSTGSSFLTLSSSSIGSAYHGESEQKIYDLFAEAKAKSPCLILIDEIDGLFPNRDSGGEVERRLVGALLTCMDGIEDKVANIQSHQEISSETPSVPMHATSPPRVMVIATTNRPNAIDPALRRPGRFDRELEIGIPDASARFKILQVLLRKVPHQLTVDQIKLYADRTHGYVGADLVSLIRTAGLGAIKRSIQSQPTPPLKEMKLEADDVEKALLTTRPSAMREVFIETPKVKWADVGGQHIVKQKLRECVEWPMRYSQTFKTLGIRPTRGVLLYGPPGCSKTLIAKALASESGLNFISLKGSEIFHKYVGESEKSIRDLFRKARAASPSVVFLDEIDTIAASRSSEESGGSGTQDRVLTSLLTEMDGIEELNGVLVLAATNRPDVIDSALMRPGRLDRILYVGPPDFESRKEILKINFGKMSISNEVKIDRLAEMTDGCTGAEIVSMCQDAALVTMNKDLDATQVSEEDLLEAAHQIRRRITPETIKMYEDWRDRSGVRSA
ncbi:ATPase family protein [Melampsora americana]|nr:ATPase family protein [Melampsora americana]